MLSITIPACSVTESKSSDQKSLSDLEFLITDAEYGDASALVSNNKQFDAKLAKLVIELDGLSEIAPKDIVTRKEQEVLNLIKTQKV